MQIVKRAKQVIFVALTIISATLLMGTDISPRYQPEKIPVSQIDFEETEIEKENSSTSLPSAEIHINEEQRKGLDPDPAVVNKYDREVEPEASMDDVPVASPAPEPTATPAPKPAAKTTKPTSIPAKKSTSALETTPATELAIENPETGTDSEIVDSESAETTSTQQTDTTAAQEKPANGIKYIAFTFDDGPSKSTGKLLSALAKNNDKVTFFVLGQEVNEDSGGTVARAANEGHEIGNHTYNHPNLTKLSSARIKKELELTDNAVIRQTGEKPTLMRPPGGNYNSTVLQAAGRPVILWNKDPADWRNRSRSYVRQQVLSQAKDGDIMILHDIYSTTVDGFIDALPELHSRGFKLVTVSEMMRIKGINMHSGSRYKSAR